MANEAVQVQRMSDPIDHEVADGVGIEKGTILRLTDARKASGSVTASGALCAGIARREKIAGDGRTQLSIFYDGIYRVKASGAIGVGDALMLDTAPNHVRSLAGVPIASGASIIGYAKEDAADAAAFQMRLQL